MRPAFVLFLTFLLCGTPPAPAQDARLLRFPDIHQSRIAFVYAGDIWIVDRTGGEARQLTTHEGQELFPKFSPDGRWIAFSAEYTGTRQIYVMPAEGGEPKQLTWYTDVGPMPPRGGYDHQVLGWTPDSRKVLFRANRTPWGDRIGRYFLVPIDGGLETPLPIPEGGSGELSPDGTKMVYTPIEREWRTWKRTRGGRAQDLWMFDLKNLRADRLTDHIMTDNLPMWIGNTIYFTSDRDHTLNLYSLDPNTKAITRLTQHTDYDVLWPSSGPDAIVYQCGGWLYVYDLKSGQSEKVPIHIGTDHARSLATWKNLSTSISGSALSPSGKRALFEARGDLFTVPAKQGLIRNLTATQGVREHSASWSPDGKWIAYLSDASGEYEVLVRTSDGSGSARAVTSNGAPWKFAPVWSPDSKKLAFGDRTHRLFWVDVESGAVSVVDTGIMADITTYDWSPDSKWIVYTNATPSKLSGIWVYSLDSRRTSLLSSGFSNDTQPVFSADGRSLFFLSNRDFNLTFSSYEFTYVYNNATRIYVGALTSTAPPFRPFKSDEEGGPDKKTEGSDKAKPGPVSVRIDPEGFAERVTALPLPTGSYGALRASATALFYMKFDGGSPRLMRYDLDKNKEDEVLAPVADYDLSADGTQILVTSGGRRAIVDAKPGQKIGENALDLGDLQMRLEPQREYRQIFDDAWRLMRDWFYDPNMHGVDWPAMRERYVSLVPYVDRRNDLDFILGEMIGELNAGHTYVASGDEPRVKRNEGGLLGCEFEDSGSGFYRIARILYGENWHKEFRSPLREPGLGITEGDYLIAINGQVVTTKDNPYRLLEGRGGKTVMLKINGSPSETGAREVAVETIASETNLRFVDWVRRTREYVEQKSQGRIGYIWMPNTASEGNRELFKWFYPQANKDALIIDDRYNGGGFIPYNMIALLNREVLNYWARRGVEPFTAPDVFHQGPKVCLINGYSSSGGDAFPYYFRKLGMGELIGTRTWGGLIGLTGNPAFVDGGSLSIPTFRIFDTEGKWIIENEGVSPDIEVIDRPDLVARGIDPSVDKAIEVLLKKLAEKPPRPVPIPRPPDESR